MLDERMMCVETGAACSVLTVARPAVGLVRKPSRARPCRAVSELFLLGPVVAWYGRMSCVKILCSNALLRSQSARPLALRGKRTSRGGFRVAAGR